MEFKIDTKPSYIHITPVTNHLNANLTAMLRQKFSELDGNGNNYIVDLHNCLDADKESFTDLGNLHEECYSNEQSIVFTAVNEDVMKALKEEEIDMSINIAPTMAEAIDIVNMEILERDLFKEE